jgi:WD40 repeat protein
VAISHDGRRVAAGGGVHIAEYAHVRVWDLESGEEFILDAEDGSQINDVLFTPQGELVSAGPWGVRLWDIEAGTFEVLSDKATWKLASSPDGNLLVASAWPLQEDRRPYVYNRAEKQWRAVSTHGNRAVSVTLDPTGAILVTSQKDIVRVGPLTGEEPHWLVGGSGPVAVSPDGKWIASGGEDKAVRLWPMPDVTEPPLHTLPHDEFVAKLKTLTNARMVPDETSETGYRLDADPFPGWETSPIW